MSSNTVFRSNFPVRMPRSSGTRTSVPMSRSAHSGSNSRSAARLRALYPSWHTPLPPRSSKARSTAGSSVETP